MKLLSYAILAALLMSIGTPLVGAEEMVDPWGEPRVDPARPGERLCHPHGTQQPAGDS
jgi:hypothetical protein